MHAAVTAAVNERDQRVISNEIKQNEIVCHFSIRGLHRARAALWAYVDRAKGTNERMNVRQRNRSDLWRLWVALGHMNNVRVCGYFID